MVISRQPWAARPIRQRDTPAVLTELFRSAMPDLVHQVRILAAASPRKEGSETL